MTARALMLLGTGSHVGKSLLAAAFCRIFKQDGYRVAPFKAQNMALNSAATPDGGEIGRAQAMQAEAAGVVPTTDMNPVLIKPSSDMTAQYVVRGKVWKHLTAGDYFNFRVRDLFPLVVESYERLASEYDIVVLEGAGSPAEVNLRDRDIVNLRMARAANANCLLVGDIDRGGVFASLHGTLALLEPDERDLVSGVLINKFRGDITLLDPHNTLRLARIDKPCLGVIPYLRDVGLDEEDGVSLEDRRTVAREWRDTDESANRRLRVGVIALPYLSNFTDFDALAAEPSVALAYIQHPAEITAADVVILPGSKQTLHDLRHLRDAGFEGEILAHAAAKPTIGICGGMQMLGLGVEDPHGGEGGGAERGLGLLRIHTVLAREKVTTPAVGRLVTPMLFGMPLGDVQPRGYEIHLGETEYEEGTRPLQRLERAVGEIVTDGAVSSDGRVVGTYLHGIFDDDTCRHAIVSALRAARGLTPAREFAFHQAERVRRFDRLADHVRSAVDMAAVYRLLDI